MSERGTGATGNAGLEELVEERIRRLQGQYLQNTSAGVARLSALRRAVTRQPGEEPEVWGLTVDGVSPAARDDGPTTEERAVHAAMTLYAVHQQSRSTPMHRRGVGLGQAVRTLGRSTVNEEAARRRFDTCATASSFGELLHHARGLVGQLRAQSVPLDYARLAVDLRDWQDPTRTAVVRLRWGRQYHRVPADAGATPIPNEPEEIA